MIGSLRENPMASLYHMISKVYVPLLRSGDDGFDKNSLRDLLYSLRAVLHQSVRKGGTNLQKFDFNMEEFRGIVEPLDEIEIWQ